MSVSGKDPLNLIITGVGGQGNVLISRLIGQALVDGGMQVTVGETYGASQRGGSVASHVRISRQEEYGPITPEGHADVILGLEPVETLRILGLYGSPETFVVTNIRPFYPLCVATGEVEYPSLKTIKKSINELSEKAWYIDASKIALDLGAPLLANMVMVGAIVGLNLLPLTMDMFERQLRENFEKERLSLNLKAFRMGLEAFGS